MRDLTTNEMGSLLFKVRDDLEAIATNLSKWRTEGYGADGMVPLAVIAAETKILSTISNVEDLIQILAKISRTTCDRY